jgi:ankyrin repeat protein
VAADRGHDAIVKQLLAAGADVKSQRGVLMIVYIIDTNVRVVVSILLYVFIFKDGRWALIVAAWRGHDAIVKQLLDAGADVNIQDEVIMIICIIDTNVRVLVIILLYVFIW